MKTKIGCLTIALCLSSLMLGGCPTTTGVDNILDTPDVQTPADNAAPADNQTPDDGASTNNDDNGASVGGAAQPTNDDPPADANNDGQDNGDNNGDANGGDGGDDDTPAQTAFTGAYSGAVACTKSESLGGPLGLEQSWNDNINFAFNADGLPIEFSIPGYGQSEGGVVFVAQVNQVGDTVTLTETQGTYTGTLTVSVAITQYDDDSGRIVLQLEHSGVKNALTEEGTGACVIEFARDGANLTYSSVTDYEVILSGMINTLWHVECTGTLAP